MAEPPVSCTAAPALFQTTCMDNLVIKVEPITAVTPAGCPLTGMPADWNVFSDGPFCSYDSEGNTCKCGKEGSFTFPMPYAPVSTNCFTTAYESLTLTDLLVSPEGDSNDTGNTCTAATKSKTTYTDGGDSTDNKFWGAATLEDAVGSDAIYFSASSCGIKGAVTDVSGTNYMQFKTTLMSSFSANTGDILTDQEMLETDIICNYELSVDGIMVAITPQLDAVDEADKIDQDEDTNEIAETEVTTAVTQNGNAYVADLKGNFPDVTLGSAMKIDFTAIGELETGYYIESCVANNEVADSKATTYKDLELVTSGCASLVKDATMTTINPTLDATSTVLSFDQFAFVDSTSTFDAPVLKFELNCVLKFGTAPTPAQCAASGLDDDDDR